MGNNALNKNMKNVESAVVLDIEHIIRLCNLQ